VKGNNNIVIRQFDLIVIGAGPGGYTAALKAADLNMSVAVIDKDKLGGVCLNRGCMPTKALLYASSIFSMMQRCDDFGVSTDFISFDFSKMQEYKKRSVLRYRSEIEYLFKKRNIEFIRATAVIHRNKTVEITNEDGKEYLRAKSIIIATGARPVIPDIPGIAESVVIDSDRLLAAKEWNFDRIVIVGGGVIGVEFAAVFQALCSNVTIVEKGDHLLGPMDIQVAEALEKKLRDKGIVINCNTTIEWIKEQNCTLYNHATGERHNLKASQIVIAVGRTPYTEGLLGADAALKFRDGKLLVDADFMTSEPGIYAIGDVVAKTQLAHVAAAQGTYVVEKIAGCEHSIMLEVVPNGMYVPLPIVPNCIYTSPEIATVGLTEQAAVKRGMKVRCGVCSMDGNGKSIITKEEGFIRLIFEAYSNTIIGAQIVCPRATDMIGEMATAIANGLTARQLDKAMRAHPTYSEGITGAIHNAINKGEDVNE